MVRFEVQLGESALVSVLLCDLSRILRNSTVAVAPLLPSLPENVYETLPAVARLRCRAWHIARTNAKTLPVRRCPCRGHYAAGWSAWLVRRCYHPEALLDPARSCLTYLDMVKHQMKHSTQCQQYFLCLGFSLENSWRACST